MEGFFKPEPLGAWNWTSQVLEKIWKNQNLRQKYKELGINLDLPSWIPTAFLFWSALGMLHFHMGVSSCWQSGIKSAENQLLAARIVSEFCPDKDN